MNVWRIGLSGIRKKKNWCRINISYLRSIFDRGQRDGSEADVVFLDDGRVETVEIEEEDVTVVEACQQNTPSCIVNRFASLNYVRWK